jgi:hypothetical protein
MVDSGYALVTLVFLAVALYIIVRVARGKAKPPRRRD